MKLGEIPVKAGDLVTFGELRCAKCSQTVAFAAGPIELNGGQVTDGALIVKVNQHVMVEEHDCSAA